MSTRLSDYNSKNHIISMLVDLDDMAEDLNENEIDFVSKMRERYEQYGENMYISGPQVDFLDNLADKHLP